MGGNSTRPRRALRIALALALACAAVALWSDGAVAGGASSALATQSISATVLPTVSWTAPGCTSSATTTAEFGEVQSGSAATSTAHGACITSNAPWSVTAEADGPLVNRDEHATIGAGALSIRMLDGGSLPPSACAGEAEPCTLDAPRGIVSRAPKGAFSFDYAYRLQVPADAAAGRYTGTVVLTASN